MKKLTSDDNVIKNAKLGMVDKIRASIDIERLQEVLSEIYSIEDPEEIEYQGGDIIIHEDDLGVKLQYKVVLSQSVLLDGQGNLIIPNTEPAQESDDEGESSRSWEE